MSSDFRRIINVLLAYFFVFSSFVSAETGCHVGTAGKPVDYIVIGGGTAGCPLAATLSEKASVLLLERGGSPYDSPGRTDMKNFAATLSDRSPDSPSQQFVSEDGVYNARARVLGGGSVINAGFYTRASPGYVREVGWEAGLVNSSYEWVEKKVAHQPPILTWQSAVRDGLKEAGVLPYNGFTYDHIYGTKVGGTIFDREGHRHSAADLLEYANPNTTLVYLHATAHKILFTKKEGSEKPKAYGVIFQDKQGRNHTVELTGSATSAGEVIVSAGAIGSPQLLILSGVGPKDQLAALGIEVVVEQPRVGSGMSDNPMNAVFIPSPEPVETSLIQVVGITKADSYIEASSGISFYSSPHELKEKFKSTLFNKTGKPSKVSEETETVPSPDRNLTISGGVILEKIMGPLSTGNLRLRTIDPNQNPSVRFNYFQEPEDLNRCVQGMKTIIDVLNSKPLSKFLYPGTTAQDYLNLMLTLPVNLRPRHPSAASSLEQFCNDTVVTIWHYHGGCRVGEVVDKDSKVYGVDGLRVVDGSTFFNSPGTNPQATLMMLGRYMGQKILEERIPKGK